MGEWLRRSAPILVGIAALGAVLSWLVWGPREPADLADLGGKEASQAAPRADDPDAGSEPGRNLPDSPLPPPEAPAQQAEDGEGMDDAMAAAWASVDLEEVYRAMPDNLYFELSVPTKDEAVLSARQAERERWNVEYGKILSGTGTEEEIRAYYDHRARLSTDNIEFATYLLDHYGDALPERDVGLLELARKLNAAHLEEIPRKVEEAMERKRQQDEAREAWLADEAAMGGAGPEAEE